MTDRTLQLGYTRVAAVVTAACYAAGHAAIGLPLLLAGWVWRLLTLRAPLWYSSRLDLPLAVFAASLILSAATSAYPSITWPSVAVTLVPGVVFLGSFAWLMHRAPGARLALLRAWALGGPPAAAIGIIAGRLMHDRPFFPGMPLGSNGFGTTLLVASLSALGIAFRTVGRGRALWLACSFVSLIGLITTISRSAWAGWVVGALYLTWYMLRDRPRRLAGALAGGLVVLAIAGTLSPRLVERVQNPWGDFARDRLLIWQVSVKMVAAHPWLGTGPGTFKTVFDQVRPEGLGTKWSAHNLWLHFAAETGLLGLLSIIWVVVVATRDGFRPEHGWGPETETAQPIVAAMWFGLLANQFGDNTLVSVSTIAGFLLLMAMLVVPSPTGVPRPARDFLTMTLDGERPAPSAERRVPVGPTPARPAGPAPARPAGLAGAEERESRPDR